MQGVWKMYVRNGNIVSHSLLVVSSVINHLLPTNTQVACTHTYSISVVIATKHADLVKPGHFKHT